MKRYLITIIVWISCWGATGLEVTPGLINELAEQMRTNHPALRVEAMRVEGAVQNSKGVRTWEDPTVRLGGMGAPTMMRADDGDLIYGVEQKLPLFGKPKLNRKLSEAEVEMARSAEDAKFQELRRDFAKVLYKAALSDETLKFLETDLGWLETFVNVVQEQYHAGDAAQIDVLRFQTELARRKALIETERDNRKQNRAEIARYLSEDIFESTNELSLPELAPEVVFTSRLSALALKFEPEIKVMNREREVAAANAALTHKQRLPEFAVGAEARNYSGNGNFRQAMVTVSFNIPIGNRDKYKADYKREMAKVAAVEFRILDSQRRVVTEIQGLVTRIAAARREALVYRDTVIPQTERALENLMAGLEANRAPLRDLLETRRMLVEGRSMYAKAVAEQYEAIAELILCCGVGDLEALEMVLPTPEKGDAK